MELTEHLRSIESTTVDALADTMRVSARTIQRDLGALRAQGLPIVAEAGPGGGVRLRRSRGASAVHLSLAEVVTLWLSARLSQAASDLPFCSAARSGMAKLMAAMPPERARELRALQRRVVIGPAASPNVRAGLGQPPPELLRLFEQAFCQGCALSFDYRDREGTRTRRRVEPHGLLVQSPVWYILALDPEKNAPRMFRMDRITNPRLVLEHRFEPDRQVIEAQLCDGGDWRFLMGS